MLRSDRPSRIREMRGSGGGARCTPTTPLSEDGDHPWRSLSSAIRLLPAYRYGPRVPLFRRRLFASTARGTRVLEWGHPSRRSAFLCSSFLLGACTLPYVQPKWSNYLVLTTPVHRVLQPDDRIKHTIGVPPFKTEMFRRDGGQRSVRGVPI